MKPMYKSFTSLSKTARFSAGLKTFLCAALSCGGVMNAPAQCNNTTVVNINGPATATWTAPASGGPFSVRITARGGDGGNITNIFRNSGGQGATMSGTFVVQNSETLRAIAGDFGKNATLEGAGAGGGSGAVNCGTGGAGNCSNGTILIIAAGGNGGDEFIGLGASSAADGDGDGGQTGGNPAHPNDWGGGGGGVNGSGQSSGSGGTGGGQVILTGPAPGGPGSGNQVPNNGGAGMGGGGGGGDYGGGGGGGHTGANGGNDNAARSKSFNSGEDQSNSDGPDGFNFTGSSAPAAVAGNVTIVCLGALPVELINFKAVMRDKAVQLLWSTASEKDNFGYDLERSPDGANWGPIGFVPGNGTTTRRNDYAFTDEHPLPGVNYYRLKQTDTDGAFHYSPIVVADVRLNGQLSFDIYPNPSSDGSLCIRTVSGQEGEARLEIFDWAGYKVYTEKWHLPEGTVVFPFSLATFPKGAYSARLELPDGSVQCKKILLHNGSR